MGHCISDSTTNEERYKTEKLVSYHIKHSVYQLVTSLYLQYDDEGAEPEFYTKKMNDNVTNEVESFKRA